MDIMNMYLWILLIITLVTVFRMIQTPGIWDRVLGFSVVTTKIVLMTVLFASITDTAFLLDLAIIYVMFGFLGEIFLVTFLSNRIRGGKAD